MESEKSSEVRRVKPFFRPLLASPNLGEEIEAEDPNLGEENEATGSPMPLPS